MTRDHEEHLLAFASAQSRAFDSTAWVAMARSGVVTIDELVATALFLAGGYWYGHSEELFSVAEELLPGRAGHFSVQASNAEFDCSRFDASLKARISHESRLA